MIWYWSYIWLSLVFFHKTIVAVNYSSSVIVSGSTHMKSCMYTWIQWPCWNLFISAYLSIVFNTSLSDFFCLLHFNASPVIISNMPFPPISYNNYFYSYMRFFIFILSTLKFRVSSYLSHRVISGILFVLLTLWYLYFVWTVNMSYLALISPTWMSFFVIPHFSNQ